jgi:hypothetical protein
VGRRGAAIQQTCICQNQSTGTDRTEPSHASAPFSQPLQEFRLEFSVSGAFSAGHEDGIEVLVAFVVNLIAQQCCFVVSRDQPFFSGGNDLYRIHSFSTVKAIGIAEHLGGTHHVQGANGRDSHNQNTHRGAGRARCAPVPLRVSSIPSVCGHYQGWMDRTVSSLDLILHIYSMRFS